MQLSNHLFESFIIKLSILIFKNNRMLKNKIFLYVLGGALTLTTMSCEKEFTDINTTKDFPTNVPPGLLLTGIEGDLATTQGGDMARFTAMITQQATGADRQFIALNAYSYTSDSFDPMWKNTYTGHMNNLRLLREKADKEGYNHYAGIARCLEAYTLMQTSDVFGAIPYSEAFKGTDNLQPKYDTQESIYATAQTKLDEALVSLAAAPGAVKPNSDDRLYGGDAALWIKFAHTLKARAYLHWGKKDPANYGKALLEVAAGISSATEEARFGFFGGQPGGAPMYQFIAQRGGYLAPNATYGNIMTATGDTKRTAFYNIAFEDGHPFFKSTQKLGILTATEAKFIKAECEFRVNGATAVAKTALDDAIAQSYADLGLAAADAAAYIAAQPATVTLQSIIEQKYLAMYCDPEVFSDWRRTGFPSLTPTGPAIPRRFLYPTSETNLNSNVPAVTITSRVAWDIQ